MFQAYFLYLTPLGAGAHLILAKAALLEQKGLHNLKKGKCLFKSLINRENFVAFLLSV